MGLLATKHNRWRLHARQDRARIDAFETEIEHLKAERNALEAENTTLKMDNIESKEVNEYLCDKVEKLKGALSEIEKLKAQATETPDNERTSAIVTENERLKMVVKWTAKLKCENYLGVDCKTANCVPYCMPCQAAAILKQEADDDDS